MANWLDIALDYVPRWIDYQMAHHDQPGASIAIAHEGRIVFERAFGVASLDTREPLTPRHRFRIASHSKTFTSAGILKLREAGKLALDDNAGRYVAGLHPDVARVTIGQLLSHTAGLTRDGADSGQFADTRPYLSATELKADLARPQPLGPAETFKYSNHGIALLGLIIEAVTGEAYGPWALREVVRASGLEETVPDMPMLPSPRPPFASGHSTKVPHGRRFVVPGEAAGNAIASAGGYVATARDLALFYSSLDPSAPTSILSPATRREMTRRQMRDRHSALERYYGYGMMIGPYGPWSNCGHGGSWQGTLSRTAFIPDQRLTISVLTNAVDGPSQLWLDGIVSILRTLHTHAAGPDPATAHWTGRFWTLWGANDLVPIGGAKVLVAMPVQPLPFMDASVLAVTGDTGRVAEAQAFGDLAEPVSLERASDGTVTALRLGGKRLLPEAAFKAQMARTYTGAPSVQF